MPNIENFKGSFTEMARPNRFRVSVDGISKLEFMGKGAQLPGSTIGVMDVPYQGRVIKMPGDRVFNDWTVTIYNDVDMSARRELEAWIELLNGNESNIGYTVKREAIVEQLGRDGSVIATFKLHGIIPLDISAIDLAFDSNDTPSEVTASFAYDWHEMI